MFGSEYLDMIFLILTFEDHTFASDWGDAMAEFSRE